MGGGEHGREGVGRMGWSEGGKWDNCNSIINKYILKNKTSKKIAIDRMTLIPIIHLKEIITNVHKVFL